MTVQNTAPKQTRSQDKTEPDERAVTVSQLKAQISAIDKQIRDQTPFDQNLKIADRPKQPRSQDQSEAGKRAFTLSQWKAQLSTLDKQILEFDQNPKEQKWKIADNTRSSLIDIFRTLSGVLRGPLPDLAPGSADLYSKDLPKNVSLVLKALAGQSYNDISSSPFAKMVDLLEQAEFRDIGGRGNNWDTPATRSSIQQVQKIWKETKPKVQLLLADAAALESISRTEDLRLMRENPTQWAEEKMQAIYPQKAVPADKRSPPLGKPLRSK